MQPPMVCGTTTQTNPASGAPRLGQDQDGQEKMRNNTATPNYVDGGCNGEGKWCEVKKERDSDLQCKDETKVAQPEKAEGKKRPAICALVKVIENRSYLITTHLIRFGNFVTRDQTNSNWVDRR